MNASWDSTSWSKPCEPKRRLTFIGQHIIILQVLVNIGTPKAHESLLWEHSKYAHFNFLSNLTTYSPLKKFLCVACGCGNTEGFVSLRVHVEFVGMWRNINIYINNTHYRLRIVFPKVNICGKLSIALPVHHWEICWWMKRPTWKSVTVGFEVNTYLVAPLGHSVCAREWWKC